MPSQSLTTRFYQSFDASRIAGLIQKLSTKTEAERRLHPDFMAEGSHFQAFAVGAQPMKLVVKLAKTSFTAQGPARIRGWRRAIQQLKSMTTNTLIPPMEILEYGGNIAIVMPRGQHITKQARVAKSLEFELIDMAQALGQAGLVLDDYPQIMQCDGVAFVGDWSDLQVAKEPFQ